MSSPLSVVNCMKQSNQHRGFSPFALIHFLITFNGFRVPEFGNNYQPATDTSEGWTGRLIMLSLPLIGREFFSFLLRSYWLWSLEEMAV